MNVKINVYKLAKLLDKQADLRKSVTAANQAWGEVMQEKLKLSEELKEARTDNERLKNLFEDKVHSHLQQLAEINELNEQLKEVRAVNEKLHDDLKFEGKDNYTITPPQMRSIIQALKRMGESLADEYADGGEGRFASAYAISLADDLERGLAR